VPVGSKPVAFGQFIVPYYQPILPVANFTSNVTSGPAPLSVQFTDLSKYTTEWNWDFGDGDSSTLQNPVHTYVTKGTYTITLTASNENGTDSKSATIIVTPINAVNISFNPQIVELHPVSSQNVQIMVDKVPAGLSGYNVTISISDSTIAEINAVSFPSWAQLPKNSTLPSSSVWIKAADLNKQINPGDTNVLLGTITVKGKQAGTSDINIVSTAIDNDNGSIVNPVVNKGMISVTPMKPYPPYTVPPTDPNHDGLYEDINGNGRLDFDDVVAYYDYMDWIPGNEPVALFDYNKNGLIDFDDVVKLYDLL
jgi:PKD repeat protein